jgi:two-component system, chemotaxis family, chemotaxis protein CheY
MKILIVEDEITSRKLMQSMLAPYGECFTASNGKEAVEAFKAAVDEEAPFDLICMDIMMPEMDGQEALKKIRALERQKEITTSDEVKVVMITALDDPKNVVEAYYKGGATSYVPKPIDRQLFINLLRNLDLIK